MACVSFRQLFLYFTMFFVLPQSEVFGWANCVRWHPSKSVVAVQTNLAIGQGWSAQNVLIIYSFSTTTRQLRLITSMPLGSGCNDVRWSPNGKYLAIAFSKNNVPFGDSSGFQNTDEVRIYSFNDSVLTPVTSVGFSDAATAGGVLSLSWRPDSGTLAIGGTGAVSGVGGFSNDNNIRTYTFFNEETLIPSHSALSTASYVGLGALQLAWSPNGQYIAVGYGRDAYPTFYCNVALYSPSLTLYWSTAASEIEYCYDVHWNPTSDRVAVSGYEQPGSFSHVTEIYAVASNSLSLNSYLGWGGVSSDGNGWTGCYNKWAEWSSDGNYLSVSAGRGSYGQGGGNTTRDAIRMYSYRRTATGDNIQYLYSRQISAIYDGYSSDAASVTWDATGGYVATGSTSNVQTTSLTASGFGTNADFRVYSWDSQGIYAITSRPYGSDSSGGGQVRSVAFSPDGNYLAVAGYNPIAGGPTVTGFANYNEIRIYQFTGGSLVPVTSINYGNTVHSVAWRPSATNPYYLAIGGAGPASDYGSSFSDTNEVRIYSFNGTGLTPITSMDYGTTVYSVAWRPDGNYLAMAGTGPVNGAGGFSNTNELRIASFNGTALTAHSSMKYGSGTTTLHCVAWHPTGHNIGTIGDISDAPNMINIYYFDPATGLTFVTGSPIYSNPEEGGIEFDGYAFAWNPVAAVGSPTTYYFATGEGYYHAGTADAGIFNEVRVFSFTSTTTPASLSDITGKSMGRKQDGRTTNARTVSWNYDGTILGYGGGSGVDGVFNFYTCSFNGTTLTDLYSKSYGGSGDYSNASCWHPSVNYFVIAGMNGLNNDTLSGFANTDQLRIYQIISAANQLFGVASQDFGASIDTTDVVRPEHGLYAAPQSAYTLGAGEHLSGAVDLGVGLASQTTQAPIPTIAITQSIHDGDLDLTQGCIRLNNSLKIGPNSNITTASASTPLGSIYLNNQTLFLEGDTMLSTAVTEQQTCVRFLSPGTIDGLGNNLSADGPVIVRTSGATSLNKHVFRNVVLSDMLDLSVGGSAARFYDDSAQGLIFENVVVKTRPGEKVTLITPSISIEGECRFEGGGTVEIGIPSYQVIAAWYGIEGGANVSMTSALAALVNKGVTTFYVGDWLMFGQTDPVPSQTKILAAQINPGSGDIHLRFGHGTTADLPVQGTLSIASGARLYVDQGTTLKISAITFEDRTATLYLDGATLLNVCRSGPMHLTQGTLMYNGLATMSSMFNSRFAIGDGTAANDLHIVGEPAATLNFDQTTACTGSSICWYRNVH